MAGFPVNSTALACGHDRPLLAVVAVVAVVAAFSILSLIQSARTKNIIENAATTATDRINITMARGPQPGYQSDREMMGRYHLVENARKKLSSVGRI